MRCRIFFGSLSRAPLKNDNAQESRSGMTMATFFFRKVKQGLLHFCSSVRKQSSAMARRFSVSFCHFLAKGTCMAVPPCMPAVWNGASERPGHGGHGLKGRLHLLGGSVAETQRKL